MNDVDLAAPTQDLPRPSQKIWALATPITPEVQSRFEHLSGLSGHYLIGTDSFQIIAPGIDPHDRVSRRHSIGLHAFQYIDGRWMSFGIFDSLDLVHKTKTRLRAVIPSVNSTTGSASLQFRWQGKGSRQVSSSAIHVSSRQPFAFIQPGAQVRAELITQGQSGYFDAKTNRLKGRTIYHEGETVGVISKSLSASTDATIERLSFSSIALVGLGLRAAKDFYWALDAFDHCDAEIHTQDILNTKHCIQAFPAVHVEFERDDSDIQFALPIALLGESLEPIGYYYFRSGDRAVFRLPPEKNITFRNMTSDKTLNLEAASGASSGDEDFCAIEHSATVIEESCRIAFLDSPGSLE